MFDKERCKYYQNLVAHASSGKYYKQGIYYISINGLIVYIGKSKNIEERLGAHLYHIHEETDESNSNKYKVLRAAKDNSIPIGFGVLEEVEDESMLAEREGFYIRKYLPALNYQIPAPGSPMHFTTNKTAKTITLEEIMVQSF